MVVLLANVAVLVLLIVKLPYVTTVTACALVPEYTTVLAALSVPNAGIVVLAIVKVALAETSVGAVNTNPDGTVKLQALVASPIITFEPAPETVQVAVSVTVALFRTLNTWLAVVKFVGAVPEPSPATALPQLATKDGLAPAFK